MEEKNIFLRVDNVVFEELYDWSNPLYQGHLIQAKVRLLNRRNSNTGGVKVKVNQVKVALFRVQDRVYAINEKCPHAGGPLHVGDIESLGDGGLCVRCPWHSWRFRLDTGHVVHPRGQTRHAQVYPVVVKDDGSIWVGFEQFHPDVFCDTDF